MQFWTPFVDGSVVPANSSGTDRDAWRPPRSRCIVSNGTDVTEVFSNDLLVEEFDVITGGNSIKFEPSFKATAQGLLVERFLAHIQQSGNPPDRRRK